MRQKDINTVLPFDLLVQPDGDIAGRLLEAFPRYIHKTGKFEAQVHVCFEKMEYAVEIALCNMPLDCDREILRRLLDCLANKASGAGKEIDQIHFTVLEFCELLNLDGDKVNLCIVRDIIGRIRWAELAIQIVDSQGFKGEAFGSLFDSVGMRSDSDRVNDAEISIFFSNFVAISMARSIRTISRG